MGPVDDSVTKDTKSQSHKDSAKHKSFAKMAKYEKSFTTAIHAQTSYRHCVNC